MQWIDLSTKWIEVNIAPLLVGTVLGTIFTFIFENFIKRPKLVVNGNGGGGGPGLGYYQNHLRITNEPGLLGIKIRETIILGKRINNYKEFGFIYDRFIARDCRAFLYDKLTDEFISTLYWRFKMNSNIITDTVTLKSGDSADLIIFAHLHNEPTKYFAYEPISNSNNKPKIPLDEEKFNGTREFVIRINDFYGKRRLEKSVTVTKQLKGGLNFEGGSF